LQEDSLHPVDVKIAVLLLYLKFKWKQSNVRGKKIV